MKSRLNGILLVGGLAIGATSCANESALPGPTATSLALDRQDARAGYRPGDGRRGRELRPRAR